MNQVNILGVRVSAISSEQLLESMSRAIDTRQQRIFAYVNVHAINIAWNDPAFRNFLNESAVTFPDGEGVRFGADLLDHPLPASTSLTRWIWNLADFCAGHGFSLFLLGGTRETSDAAAENLRARLTSLRLSSHHGYFQKTGAENERMIDAINEASPDILLVGFGMPEQERWISMNARRLNARVLMTGGSCIDYAAGAKPATPSWMTRARLEWFFRLMNEPGRLFGRYVIGNPLFLIRILMQKFHVGYARRIHTTTFERSAE